LPRWLAQEGGVSAAAVNVTADNLGAAVVPGGVLPPATRRAAAERERLSARAACEREALPHRRHQAFALAVAAQVEIKSGT
jgi:hypothetical protein